jgi:outer membrane immunogenic protein
MRRCRRSWRFTAWIAAAFLLGLGIAPAGLAQSLFDVGANYSYVHANMPPGGCGCFSMNGGEGWASYNLNGHFSVVGDFAAQRASNVIGTGGGLTLISYVFGPRYTMNGFHRIKPFGQALVGGAHASGSLAPGSSGLAGSPNAFAAVAGGGANFVLSERFAVQLIEADYYFTNFANGTNDRQNNFRISAGIVVRFGAR